MRECSSESAFLVDAEVDSMGGAIDGRVGTGIMTSPCRAEIEKTQDEIRLEIDCREERLRELEFLEKGGDPLDFKFDHAISVSVQSTSLVDQHPDQIVTSKAKDSYASAALHSRPGEALEILVNPGDTTCEANSGDNLLLFDCENKLHKDKNFKGRDCKNTVPPSEIAKVTGGNAKAKESENSAIFRPYARRNRTKSNRDGTRLGSGDVSHCRNQGSTLCRGSRDLKGSVSDAILKDQKLPSVSQVKPSNRNNEITQKNDDSRNVESVVMSAAETLTNVYGSHNELASDAKCNGVPLDCGIDHEKAQDANSCHTGIAAAETSELANGTSNLSKAPTTMPQTWTPCQSDVLVMPKGINDLHLDSITMNSGIQTLRNDSDACSNPICEDAIEHRKELIFVNYEARKSVTYDPSETSIDPEPVDTCAAVIFDDRRHCDIKNSSVIKVEEDLDLQNNLATFESLKTTDSNELQVKKNADNMIDRKSSPINDMAEVQISAISLPVEDSKTIPPGGFTTDKDVPDNACSKKVTDKVDEDSILAEAKLILAKRKRLADLSTRSLPLKNCEKSHWDFLLEEVAWLANDFMQERAWKVTAAAQLVRHSAMSFHERHQNQMPVQRLKFVAYSFAKAVMKFWHTCETMDVPDSLESQSPYKSLALRSYAQRFFRYNKSTTPSMEVEDPVFTSDMLDSGLHETSGESCITEDNLFYDIPTGAMQCYRTSIESYVLQCEKNGSTLKEDDAAIREVNEATMERPQYSIYDEDEGETSLQYPPGTVEWGKAAHFPHRKQKGLKRTYSSGSYELEPDITYGSHLPGAQRSVLVVKRSATQNIVSIPIKRMRTASRQRVLGSLSGAGTVNTLVMNKTDASSEDTNSYQDDKGSLHGGSQVQRSLEVESPVDYESYLQIDSEEISTKHKKRKTDKNMGDHSKRRLENNHLGSNGGNGLFGHHKPKKFKISKRTFENLLDNGGPLSGSMPLPGASQMNNMSSANEYKRMMAYRDRFKKTKGTKLPIPMSGSGNAWTSFEDQALVVLVHDLGPNWYLVSDAINSTLQVKHIFREPKECKERHKSLMDQTAGDAADSADDSGSSQPYPSTMPGIPKGSARQLFQRLHGPMEEDLVKSHFDKIITIGQRQYHHRKQCDSHDQKHITPHNSHFIAISQVSSNNLNGGILTPLDLIDAIMPSPDALALGYHCPQTNGFNNQSFVPPVLAPGMPVGGSISSPSGSNTHWSGRYRVSMPSLPVDEQQRVQQSSSMLSGRNTQQSTILAPGPQPVSDRFGPCKLQGANGVGMITGINNRGKQMSRSGFQGLGTPAMLDSAAVLSSGMVSMKTLDIQSSSVHRKMDNSHQIRPGQSLDYHRQKLVPGMQMRATQASSHCIAPSGINASFTGQSEPSSGQSFSAHPQQKHQKSLQQSHDLTNQHLKGTSHAIGSQHPAFARMVKERQLQQQIFQRQQQYNASNSMIPQSQQQLSVSLQNCSHVQPQTSQGVSPSSPLAPVNNQMQQKHHLPPHGLPKNSQSGSITEPSYVPKQRQRHPQQPQQRPQSVRPLIAQQLQQLQDKHVKGDGRGNVNGPVDQSNLNGQSPFSSPGGQSTEDGEQALQLVGSQNSVQPSRTQRLNMTSQSQSLQVSPLLDNGNLTISHEAISLHLVSSPNQPRLQIPSNSHPKSIGQTQVNNAVGSENSPYLSMLDDQDKEAPSVSNSAATPQNCAELLDDRSDVALLQQTPESFQQSPMQNVTSQSGFIDSLPTVLPGSDSSLISSSVSLRKKLSGGATPSAGSVGERWQQKTQVPCPLSPSTSQQKE